MASSIMTDGGTYTELFEIEDEILGEEAGRQPIQSYPTTGWLGLPSIMAGKAYDAYLTPAEANDLRVMYGKGLTVNHYGDKRHCRVLYNPA